MSSTGEGSSVAPWQTIETIFDHAERQALLRTESDQDQIGALDLQAENDWFVEAARREMSRRAQRAKVLPEELLADNGWLILLDIFVSEHRGQRLSVPNCTDRWTIGKGTSMRQIAGLIASGLIERESANDSSSAYIQLTHYGTAVLRSALMQSI